MTTPIIEKVVSTKSPVGTALQFTKRTKSDIWTRPYTSEGFSIRRMWMSVLWQDTRFGQPFSGKNVWVLINGSYSKDGVGEVTMLCNEWVSPEDAMGMIHDFQTDMGVHDFMDKWNDINDEAYKVEDSIDRGFAMKPYQSEKWYRQKHKWADRLYNETQRKDWINLRSTSTPEKN